MLTRRGIEMRIRAVIAECALVPENSFTLDAELHRSGIDSLSMLRAIAEVETEFAFVIADEEFPLLRTLRDLIDVVERRGVERAA